MVRRDINFNRYLPQQQVPDPTENDSFYTDPIDHKGNGTYTYKVCEAGTSACSNEATASFG